VLSLQFGAETVALDNLSTVPEKDSTSFPSSSLGTRGWVTASWESKLELLHTCVPKLELGNEGMVAGAWERGEGDAGAWEQDGWWGLGTRWTRGANSRRLFATSG
jgi:hypothetical protein